jgi:hypothetical protein
MRVTFMQPPEEGLGEDRIAHPGGRYDKDFRHKDEWPEATWG